MMSASDACDDMIGRNTESLSSYSLMSDNDWERIASEGSTRTTRYSLSACPQISENANLRRGARPSQILRCFAEIFASRKLWHATHSMEQPILEGRSNHKESDDLFYSTRIVERVSAFVSHVWGAPRWQKALALYYYMNAGLAVCASITTWVLLMVWMIWNHGVAGMGGNPNLLTLFIGGPLLSFFIVLFTGHYFVTTVQTLWLDKMCIHQTRIGLKLQGVSALPEVVASSDRLVILWNDTYFERLWCNAEVATFLSMNDGSDKMDFVPLWLTPWILATMMLDVVSIGLSSRLFVLIPLAASWFGDAIPSAEPWLINFLAQFVGIGIAFSVGYMPVVIPNWLSFKFKLDAHDQMMTQCKQFKLQNAKCTDESDRPVVEQLVQDLWYDSPCPIQAFNEFVNEELFKHLAWRIGRLDRLPYRVSLLVFLPLTFSAAVNVLGCDQMPCDIAAQSELGPTVTVAQQMVTNTIAWTVGIFGVYPTMYPVMLSLLCASKVRFGSRPCLRRFADLIAIIASYMYMGFHEGFAAGIINTASAQSAISIQKFLFWISAVFVYLILLVRWNLYLFNSEEPPISVTSRLSKCESL